MVSPDSYKICTLNDLGIAYRKAKVDLYYSSHASILDIANYEEKLVAHLEALLGKINGQDEAWIESTDFLGDWTLAAKSISWPARKKFQAAHGNGIIFSSPSDEWQNSSAQLIDDKQRSTKPKAEFRIMAHCSLDFHVLSALWMLKVGHLYDAKLTGCAHGNRLRRTRDNKNINPLSLGSFVPYLHPFREWRDAGIATMSSALKENKKIVALTADVTSFYHELSPRFMLLPEFIEDVLSLELSEPEQKLNRLFIHALEAWAANTPLKKGLPVGLPASAIVANMALIELDRLIEHEIAPLYYGRYVDDILLVIENGKSFQSTSELWEWLFARSNSKLAWVKGKENSQICFQPKYLKQGNSKSRIRFANNKNKVFILAGETGQTLVDAISHQIHERASEWRALPRLPRSSSHIGTDLLAATQSNGEAADNLRKADALTMRRAGFAIKLRDFEAYERDLAPGAWKEHRHAFLRAVTQHVLVLPQFFELEAYLPRIVRLATACEDFKELRKLINALERLCIKVLQDCTIHIKACPKKATRASAKHITARWQKQLFSSIRESISAAFPPHLSAAGKRAWQTHMSSYHPTADFEAFLDWPLSTKAFQAQQERLFSFDLAHMPFRFIGLPREMVAQRGIPRRKDIETNAQAMRVLPDSIKRGSSLLASLIKFQDVPQGLLFATRPFNLPELFVLYESAYTQRGQADMRAMMLSLRGFTLGDKMPHFDSKGVLRISDRKTPLKYNVAVSSWSTLYPSWVASVKRAKDPDISRYSRLNHLLNNAASYPHQSRYLILPELAMPAHWFIRIALKLQRSGISLITGIEYIHSKKTKVHNQVWAALNHDGLGFPSILIYRQDKQQPALHEERELHRLAKLKMKPEHPWKKPPIIQHGDFRFALLICSELTNIAYRTALRGKIDALFVPEWNQDTETFNALVESAALDIHAYIIQCNDRQYGDSRIRAPYKENWKRDILRVKGGIADYSVIGEIDVQALRQFQSSHRSPAGPFKPVPDGFKINRNREVLPVGETV